MRVVFSRVITFLRVTDDKSLSTGFVSHHIEHIMTRNFNTEVFLELVSIRKAFQILFGLVLNIDTTVRLTERITRNSYHTSISSDFHPFMKASFKRIQRTALSSKEFFHRRLLEHIRAFVRPYSAV